MLCLDRQTDQITVSGHYIGTTPCLWKTQEEGERFLVTGDDRPTTEKIHAVSIYIGFSLHCTCFWSLKLNREILVNNRHFKSVVELQHSTGQHNYCVQLQEIQQILYVSRHEVY